MIEAPAIGRPHRSGLARKHALLWSALVSLLLTASGLAAAYFAYVDTVRGAEALQREKAAAAAERISTFIAGIEQPLRWAVSDPSLTSEVNSETLSIELGKLLQRLPVLSDLRWIDGAGRERFVVSRHGLDIVDSGVDLSSDPRVVGARGSGAYAGPVHFRRGTEPYMSIALAARRGGQVIAAEVNLKSVWEIVTQVRFGQTGLAYVVDSGGQLLSHPDLSAVLRKTEMGQLPHVRAALASDEPVSVADAHDLQGVAVLAAAAPIRRLGWRVFVEQQRNEALAPVLRSLGQSALLIVLGVAFSVAASIVLARRLVRPIRQLQAGAAAIGAGQLSERIAITSGDELQALAEQFNQMTGNLQESYATLEARVADRTRELAHANEAKSRFLAAASHDLRQPVHALGLFVGQLRQATDPEDQRALIGHIETSIGSFEALLESLLDISRLDAGTVQVRSEAFALDSLVGRIGAGYAAEARAKGLTLRVRPQRVWVESDPVLLERILGNLLTNAIRYTAQGRVLVGCRRNGLRVEVVVADTGIGIAADQLPHVFREFYQAPRPPGAPAEGLGLGLAIVDRLARLLDHPLRVVSHPGRGTCFAISLALAAPRNEALPLAAAPALPDALLTGKRVLVVDDDAAIREAMRGQLAQWGCDVLVASGGAEALALIAQQGPPDVALVDLRLADSEDGLEVAHRIDAAARRHVPIAIVTGETEPEVLQATRSSGRPLLTKPIKPARLRALLESLLGS